MSTTDSPAAPSATDLLNSAQTLSTQGIDAIEASVKRIRELNEQAIKAARAAGLTALGRLPGGAGVRREGRRELAEGSHVDWFTTPVTTLARFTQRLGTIFLTSARDQLKSRSSSTGDHGHHDAPIGPTGPAHNGPDYARTSGESTRPLDKSMECGLCQRC